MITLIILVVLALVAWYSYDWFKSDPEDKRIEKEARERIKSPLSGGSKHFSTTPLRKFDDYSFEEKRKNSGEKKKEDYTPPVRTIDDTNPSPIIFTNVVDDSPIEHRHEPIHHHDSGGGGHFGGGGSSDHYDSGSHSHHYDSGSSHDSSSSHDSGSSFDSGSSDSGSSSFGD